MVSHEYFLVISRASAADENADVKEVLCFAFDPGNGKQISVSHIKSKIWTAKAIPRLVSKTGAFDKFPPKSGI